MRWNLRSSRPAPTGRVKVQVERISEYRAACTILRRLLSFGRSRKAHRLSRPFQAWSGWDEIADHMEFASDLATS